MRTTRKTVSFSRPFKLAAFEVPLPAGDYVVEIDEEPLEGTSFAAYRRVSTFLHVHTVPGQPGIQQTLSLDPDDLDAAIKRDRDPE